MTIYNTDFHLRRKLGSKRYSEMLKAEIAQRAYVQVPKVKILDLIINKMFYNGLPLGW
jgi:hypothetical protein